MIFRQTELDHDHGDQQYRSVEREGPRIGRKVMNEGSRRGACSGLWGLLPSSVSGKTVGTDDDLTPSPSNSGCSTPVCSFTPRRRPGGHGSESVP